MIDFDESIRLVADLANPLKTETVALDEADGRMLAEPVVAGRNAPTFAVSAMDGYAVRDRDVHDLPCQLPIIGKSFAGTRVPGSLPANACMRVFTGAIIPAGADRIVIQEDVTADGRMAYFDKPLSCSRHIRPAGSDFTEGDVLIPAGVMLNPQRLVAAAAAERTHAAVVRRPRVAIIASGDELVAPGCDAAANHIPDSLTAALAALIRRWKGIVTDRTLCPDDLTVLQPAATKALECADVVVVTGGASVGEKDFSQAMFAPHDLQLVFNKVAIRPGKPVWLGRACGTFVVGLPGNPTSALVTARLYLAPLLMGLAGFDPHTAWEWRAAVLGGPVEANEGRESFLRASVNGDTVFALSNQDSAAQKALAEATHLIRRRSGSPRATTGDTTEALAF